MQWSAAPHAGFAPPETPKTWLPIAENYREVNVERQLAKPDSMPNLYRRLLAYGKSSSAQRWGSYRSERNVPRACFVYYLYHGDTYTFR